MLDTAPGLFCNPLGIAQIGDPFILKTQNNGYWLYATSSGYGFRCWHSADMTQWEDKGLCYDVRNDPKGWGKICFWAPEVTEHGGKYYMYYSAAVKGRRYRTAVAVADAPGGPFFDAHGGPLFDFGYAAIDPNLLIDDDGQLYLYFSRVCVGGRIKLVKGTLTNELYVLKLKDFLTPDGEAKMILSPSQRWETASKLVHILEGPFALKRGGRYYLMYSGGSYTKRGYSVGYAMSERPDGGFVKAEENPVLTAGGRTDISGTGHNSVAASPSGRELWCAYHSHTDPAKGGGDRQLCLDRITFEDGGRLIVHGPTLEAQKMPE